MKCLHGREGRICFYNIIIDDEYICQHAHANRYGCRLRMYKNNISSSKYLKEYVTILNALHSSSQEGLA